jgi:hypothetical protein
MNGFLRPHSRVVVFSIIRYGVILLGAGLHGFGTADAAPIHSVHKRFDAEEAWITHSSGSRAWAEYLVAGPSAWSSIIHPQVSPAVRSAIWKALRSDRAEASPWVQFLFYKQSLNPDRFARFHPRVALALDRMSARPAARVLAQEPVNTPTASPAPPLLQAQQIPEPATWLLALGMAGWFAWWRRRSR